MEDHNFQVIRKNLNILSVLILILAFTNAKLESLNFLGLQLELNGSKFYQALYIGYCYFLWRFLTKLPLLSGFWNDFVQFYMVSEKGVKEQHTYDKYENDFINKSERLKFSVESNDPHLRLIQISVIRLPGWPLTRLRLSTLFNASGREGKNDSQQFDVNHDFTVSRGFLYRKLLFFCLKYDKFGDYLFPLVPVIAVVFFFFFNSEWQGSLLSILKANNFCLVN